MSIAHTGIPRSIEQQLLTLDKQIRDAAFIRGVGRFVFGVCLILGGCLVIDGLLDLAGIVRACLLAIWTVVSVTLMWRGVIRPMFAPVSFAALAAVVEREFPELRERLTSLVELRGDEANDLAPGASRLMQDLLARQTMKALDQLGVDRISANRNPIGMVMAGSLAIVLLLAPFAWNSDSYGLLWSRFFVPWGNFGWGPMLVLNVVEGDQVVARGSDVPIHVSLAVRGRAREIDPNKAAPLWLNWTDEQGASDERRLEWDVESKSFTTTIPHVLASVTFDVTTTGAKTEIHRIDVADPPSITRFQLDIEPAAYTGLPAKAMAGVPGEVRVTEFSRLQIQVEFGAPVRSAELLWPGEANPTQRVSGSKEERVAVEQTISIELSDDRRSGTVVVTANLTGSFAVRATNDLGLKNNDPARLLIVDLDQPPEIAESGADAPQLVRPDDVFEYEVEVRDDYGLTAVEMHVETTTGIKTMVPVPAELKREPKLVHKFTLDLAPFEMSGGQIVTYRLRVVDNRPLPTPHEVWTDPRTLALNSSLKQLPDQELAEQEKSLEDELTKVRTELNEVKEDLAKLHEQTEQESLQKQPETDKTERLMALQDAQERLMERLQQLSDRMAERRMTQDLAHQAERIANEDLKAVQDRLEQSKNQPARDQLQPLAQAIDQMGAADRQLQQLEQHLNELNKLEQDLAELSRLAQHAERLADQLEKLNAQQLAVNQQNDYLQSTQSPKEDQSDPVSETQPRRPQADANQETAAVDRTNQSAKSTNEPKAAEPKRNGDEAKANPAETNEDKELERLKDEGKKLSDKMAEMLKKHPELLDAARREQLDKLNDLAQQARNLAVPQEELAQALQQAAVDAPAAASRPENAAAPTQDSPKPRTSEPELRANDANPSDTKSGDTNSNNMPNDAAKANPGAEPKPNDTAKTNPGHESKPNSADQSDPSNNIKSNPQDQPAQVAQPPMPQNPQSPIAEQQQTSGNKNADSMPANATQPAKTLQQNQPQAQSPTQPKSNLQTQPPVAAQSDPPEMQRGSDLTKQQEQIAREAAKQAIELAQKTGADSEATKAATEFARKADQAKQQAQTGQLETAGKTAQEAAKAADQTSRQLNPEGNSNSPQAKQWSQLAEQQRKAAQQLQQAAKSPDATRGAQMQGQQQLAQATNKLAEQLDQAAASLNSKPLDSPRDAEIGDKASQTVKQAEQAMKQAEQANKQNDQQQASKSAMEAAEQLKQAANQVQQTPPSASNKPPVPKKVGSQVAQATKQMQQAQQQLQQSTCNGQCSQPGGSKPNGNPGSSPSGSSSANPSMAQSENQNPATPKPDAPPSANPNSNSPPKTGQSSSLSQGKPQDSDSPSSNQSIPVAQGDKPPSPPKDGKSNSQSTSSSSSNPTSSSPSSTPSPNPTTKGQENNSQGQAQAEKNNSAQGSSPMHGKQDSQVTQNDKPAGQTKDGKPRLADSPAARPDGESSKSGRLQGSDSKNNATQSDSSSSSGDLSQSQVAGQQKQLRTTTELTQVAQQFREVAAALRLARGEPSEKSTPGQPMPSRRTARSMPGEPKQQSEPGGTGNDASGTTETVDLSQLDAELQQQVRHSWGRLPGQLRTEILQGSGKKSHPEYSQRIKSYFDEITKPSK